MAIASSPKTLQHSYSARVFQTHMNWLPGNTLITSRLLPTTNSLMLLWESSKKRIGAKPMLLDKVPPSTSSRLRRTLGKSVQSVERQTAQPKITGPEGRTQIKKAKEKSPKSQIRLERRKWITRQRAKKRHKQVPMYYLYRNWPTCLYKGHNQLIFHAMRQVRKWNGAWMVDAQIISHQARVISSSIGN